MIVDLKNIDGKIIDIRTTIDFDNYSFSGSINIPRIKLLSDPSFYLNKNEKYYLLCSKGHESLSTAKVLNALGYTCFSIDGGIEKIKNNIKNTKK